MLKIIFKKEVEVVCHPDHLEIKHSLLDCSQRISREFVKEYTKQEITLTEDCVWGYYNPSVISIWNKKIRWPRHFATGLVEKIVDTSTGKCLFPSFFP